MRACSTRVRAVCKLPLASWTPRSSWAVGEQKEREVKGCQPSMVLKSEVRTRVKRDLMKGGGKRPGIPESLRRTMTWRRDINTWGIKKKKRPTSIVQKRPTSQGLDLSIYLSLDQLEEARAAGVYARLSRRCTASRTKEVSSKET